MHIFVYEFVAGGGWYSVDSHQSPPASLLGEGLAMLRALVVDFSQIDGAEVSWLWDRRWGAPGEIPGRQYLVAGADQERDRFQQLAAAADWTVVIAPEFSGILLDRCRQVESAGGRLLGPGPDIVALTSDKQRTAEHLAAAAVCIAPGRSLAPSESLPTDFFYPAVVKPRDGAGSQGVRLIWGPQADAGESAVPRRLERFCDGVAASVSFLCGPAAQLPLVPCRQLLSNDGHFTYLGGALPLERELARRATRLASRAIESLDCPLGYLGVDLVLGADRSGGDDVVIEINPRLTTSYVGLRGAAEVNLAAAMLAVAESRPVKLSFLPRAVQFDAQGSVCLNSHPVSHEVAGT